MVLHVYMYGTESIRMTELQNELMSIVSFAMYMYIHVHVHCKYSPQTFYRAGSLCLEGGWDKKIQETPSSLVENVNEA